MIELHEVSKQFNGLTALDNVTLHVGEGEIFGYLGQNGAGKTTTINLLVTLLTPTHGRISIAGLDISTHGRQVRQIIGYLPDNIGLYPALSVYQNLKFIGNLYQLDKAYIEGQIKYFLEFFRLTEKQHVKFKELSLGMKQKVGLAKALLHNPQVLFLDEPTKALDPISAQEILNLLLDLKKLGKTIFMTTHLLDRAEKICDSYALLNRGKIIANGSISDLRGQKEISSLEALYFKTMEAEYA